MSAELGLGRRTRGSPRRFRRALHALVRVSTKSAPAPTIPIGLKELSIASSSASPNRRHARHRRLRARPAARRLDEQSRARRLRENAEFARDNLALAGIVGREAQQHAGDVAGGERGFQRGVERRGGRKRGRNEIEAGRWGFGVSRAMNSRFSGLSRSYSPENRGESTDGASNEKAAPGAASPV